MKHLFNNEIEKLLSGVSLFGFSKDMLVVFLSGFSRYSGRRVLIVGEKESFVKDIYRISRFFKSGLLYYPEPPRGEGVPGFQAAHNLVRAQALIGLSKKKGGVCLVSKAALSLPIINKKTELKSLSVRVGKKLNRDLFCSKLHGFGFNPVEYVYNPREISVRGDVVDVFPENKTLPVRSSFEFDRLGSITNFDIDSNLSNSKLNRIGKVLFSGKTSTMSPRTDISFGP